MPAWAIWPALLPGGPGWSDVRRSLRHDPGDEQWQFTLDTEQPPAGHPWLLAADRGLLGRLSGHWRWWKSPLSYC